MARAVTKREADLLTNFGFRLARGCSFETIEYEQIVAIIPMDDGMEIIFNSRYPLEKIHATVLDVDIPVGKMQGGSPKSLETSWIFVYYQKLVEFKNDGSKTIR